ncbi:serine hydrolase [Limosilactobacillus fastidiosus]|uniref:serine hydrolase n=1 Tax=Limosilactobacillus fastidiosus TaxID=2759855 RepID=UPI0027E0A5E6|nr:serine hydrolase [Limosilactobacillus fastidiosus]
MLLHNTSGNLDSTQQSLSMRMIRNSDNNATTAILTNYLGGITSLSAIYSALGMNQTTASTWWISSLTVSIDQLKLLKMVYLDSFSNYLNDKSRNYIKWLMNTVSSSQRWGTFCM